MKVTVHGSFPGRLVNRLKQWSRLLERGTRSAMFSSSAEAGDAVSRILVINLDRQDRRWRRIKAELGRVRCRDGTSLAGITRRHSAMDARHLPRQDTRRVSGTYTLGDQVTVEPNDLLDATVDLNQGISMTVQEIAVALSHIAVWERIAEASAEFTLVLEDDVILDLGFSRRTSSLWKSIQSEDKKPDLLYLSYDEVQDPGDASRLSAGNHRRLIKPGLWYASGYVLSRAGARQLLTRLPVVGPVDLWLNHQFASMSAWSSTRSLISQREDEISTNSHSVLPVLTKLGVFNYSSHKLHPMQSLTGPLVAIGPPDTGLSALALALSILGYTCCSDLEALPESRNLGAKRGSPERFNAFINIGSLCPLSHDELRRQFPGCRIIETQESANGKAPATGDDLLILPRDHPDKWEALTTFLDLEYPTHPYPAVPEIGQRRLDTSSAPTPLAGTTELESDYSPWSIQAVGWRGVAVEPSPLFDDLSTTHAWTADGPLDSAAWKCRTDTFPGNLARFTPENVRYCAQRKRVELKLSEQKSTVRDYSSGAIAYAHPVHYGRLTAEIRAARRPGVITGFFLHRNAPRQEIDIEFLGNDTTKMLVNVYYNPGVEGTHLEYGYRGSPICIELGFDASDDFHVYEIVWERDQILWLVDGVVVHHRAQWNPTPVPNMPMELNINLWNTSAESLAGRFDDRDKSETDAHIRSVRVESYEDMPMLQDTPQLQDRSLRS